MPSTESSRADAKVKKLKRRISELSPEYKRKLTGDNPMSNLFEGLRATGTAMKGAWNAKKVDALEEKVKKLESVSKEARSLKSTKEFRAGNEWAELDGGWNKKLDKAGLSKGGMLKKKGYYNGGMVNCGASMKPNGKSRK